MVTMQGFDGEKYILLQAQAITQRVEKFSGKLYLEIGGKFLFDGHASRVLPGFLPESKKYIFSHLKQDFEIIFCMNAFDLQNNRIIKDKNYSDICLESLEEIKKQLGKIPKISINRVCEDNKDAADSFSVIANNFWYQVFYRYEIEKYPHNTGHILSQKWFWNDEYIQMQSDLILVTGPASSSGKMSTCLWQMYHDHTKGRESWYAKYETFPIWNLDIDHPVNLAYEAATADIWDYNMLDSYHKKAYGIDAINYNRDVEAFEIVMKLSKKFLGPENYTCEYKSPTDMWISNAGSCITDELVVKQACREEIENRKKEYHQLVLDGVGDEIWVARCENILKRLP